MDHSPCNDGGDGSFASRVEVTDVDDGALHSWPTKGHHDDGRDENMESGGGQTTEDESYHDQEDGSDTAHTWTEGIKKGTQQKGAREVDGSGNDKYLMDEACQGGPKMSQVASH